MRQLYAVAIEHRTPGRARGLTHVETHIEYMHADSTLHARAQFCAVYPNRRTHYIVSIGPVVGFYVDDNEKGNRFSVT